MVYSNQTITGFNIIKLNTESIEFKNARNAFIDLLHKEPLIHKVQTYPVEKHKKAFCALEKGETCGKVLLKF
jgi:NADPH:quinone reductase-like Zn-dependent oxidoreductase